MKSIIILYKDSESLYCDEKVFDGKSSIDLSLTWAKSINENVVILQDCKNLSDLFSKINEKCIENNADYVIFSYIDLPFLNKTLTEELINTHEEFKAEYTFADGYPYGFSPEIIDKGTINILSNLSKTVQENDGKKAVTREGIFEFIKKDINSYEIESILADNDWRLLRFNFDCSKKENFIASKELYKFYKPELSVEELSKIASESLNILKTVPCYYNIQIQDSCSGKCSYCPYPKAYYEKYKINPCDSKKYMDLEKFSTILNNIKNFSEDAVINLSAWGESLENKNILEYIEKVLSYERFSCFIETDGINITDDFICNIKEIVEKYKKRKSKWNPLMISISLDSFSDSTYKLIRGVDCSVKEIAEKIKKLNSVIPGCVYPQFVRMHSNENELELFYRYWNEKENESGGNLIIQKYNDFADLLPECKPADLSPVERNVCWHLRRDMTILSNGDVPLCNQFVLDGIIGNVFKDSLENIWNKYDDELKNHICGKYSEKCRKCDEFYTYNF